MIRRLLFTLAVVTVSAVPASAQWQYVGFEQITVSTAAVGFTSTKIRVEGRSQATQAFCSSETAALRWTVDGTTPTTSVGSVLSAGSTLPMINGADNLARFRAIRDDGTDVTLNCTYFAGGRFDTPLSASGSGGSSSGGGDASAANQTTLITHAAAIELATEATEVATEALQASAAASTLERYISVGTTEDENEIKATPGTLDSISAYNNHATAVAFLKCTNLTAANTTPGTSAIFYSMIIPPVSGFVDSNITASFSVALTCYIVLGEADTDVAEVAANDVGYNIRYR